MCELCRRRRDQREDAVVEVAAVGLGFMVSRVRDETGGLELVCAGCAAGDDTGGFEEDLQNRPGAVSCQPPAPGAGLWH